MGTGVARRILAAGTLALVGLHLVLARHITGPWVSPDEAGYLGSARWLAGNRHWPIHFAPFYSSGYSVLVAPITAVVHDPPLQWRVICLVNALLLASLLPLLHLVGRRVLGLGRGAALAAATIGALAPAALASSYAGLPENVVLPLAAASVLAAWGAGRADVAMRCRIWWGPAIGGLYALHPRFTIAVPATVALLAVAALARGLDRRVAAANLGGLAVTVGAARLVNGWLRAHRWEGVQNPEGDLDAWLRLLTTRSGLRELVATAAGQSWYLLAGSFGLVAVGVVAAIWWVWRPDATTVGPEADPAARAGRRLALAHLVTTASLVFMTSVVFFTQNQARVDHYIYGRHNDSFAPLWFALGTAFVVSARPLRLRLGVLAAAAVALIATATVLIHERDPLAFGFSVSSFSVPAVLRTMWWDPYDSFRVTTAYAAAGIAVGAALLGLERLRTTAIRPAAVGRAALLGALALWLVTGGFDASRRATGYDEIQYRGWHAPEQLARLGVREAAIDEGMARGRPALSYPFFLPDVRWDPYDAAAEDPGTAFTLGRLDDDRRARAGDRIALLDQGYSYYDADEPDGLALWVARGPDQRRLAAQGALLPAGFPTTPLPRSARSARITLIDRPSGAVRVRAGEAVELRARVTHTGSGAPWPDLASFNQAGRVRIATLITPLDPGGEPGARSGGELTRWMRPGDTDVVDLQVLALGAFLEPLPPGRYRVELAVVQEGFAWTARGGRTATFTMRVTR